MFCIIITTDQYSPQNQLKHRLYVKRAGVILVIPAVMDQVMWRISDYQVFWYRNSILLHSGLNPAWYFWFVNKIFLLSEDEISWEHFRVNSRTILQIFERLKPQENLWNCSWKYTKMFKTDSFLGNKKLSLNQNVWHDHYATGCFVAFLGDISTLKSG